MILKEQCLTLASHEACRRCLIHSCCLKCTTPLSLLPLPPGSVPQPIFLELSNPSEKIISFKQLENIVLITDSNSNVSGKDFGTKEGSIPCKEQSDLSKVLLILRSVPCWPVSLYLYRLLFCSDGWSPLVFQRVLTDEVLCASLAGPHCLFLWL